MVGPSLLASPSYSFPSPLDSGLLLRDTRARRTSVPTQEIFPSQWVFPCWLGVISFLNHGFRPALIVGTDFFPTLLVSRSRTFNFFHRLLSPSFFFLPGLPHLSQDPDGFPLWEVRLKLPGPSFSSSCRWLTAPLFLGFRCGSALRGIGFFFFFFFYDLSGMSPAQA